MYTQSNSTGRLLWALVSVIMLSGCASGVTRTDAHKVSAFQPSAEFPIGQVTVASTTEVQEKLKDNFKFSAEQLRGALEQALTNNQLFTAAQASQGISMDVLVTRIRVRSTFNAVMWGAMAGNDALEGEVTIKDASSKVLDKFSVSASYALGGFAGGQDGMRMGWLYEAFAKQVIGQFKPETVADSTPKSKT